MIRENLLELWGGPECTVNRVRDVYFDQIVRTGWHMRDDDIDRFADLGLRRLRFPLLWERVQPSPDVLDWSWTDRHLARCQARGLPVVAGLVHHGSGPRHADFAAEAFAPGLAAFARMAADRYPWIDAWTPVNEPLTTARFGGLYGIWYPHARDEGAFWRLLLNEIDAIRLAMAEIRRVIPGARLVQTEDLGHTRSTRRLAYQAAHDNTRRWLTWDLLSGRVTRDHAFWPRIAAHGLADRLSAIADNPCPPDIVGINHYLTSDRFLDHRLDRYPARLHGGNGRDRYADAEAVRVASCAPRGIAAVLAEAWARYATPIAVTESFNGCTREEQLRWLLESWRAAQRARRAGIDVVAVTAWALLGAYDWDSLLTRCEEHYETGAFDVRCDPPRPTALATLIRGLASGERLPDAVHGRGWWRRRARVLFPRSSSRRAAPTPSRQGGRPLLVTGATGTLGSAFGRACIARDLNHVLTKRAQLDLSDADSIARALDAARPWAVINAAGWVRVDAAEGAEVECMRANAVGAAALAEACAERGIRYVAFSSDLVFGGEPVLRPYVESDPPAPLSVYGRSKAAAEQAIRAIDDRALIVRTAAFFSPHDPHNFAWQAVRSLADGRPVRAAHDAVVSPTYVPDLVDATLDLLIDGTEGLWHLSHGEAVSWSAFASLIADRCSLDAGLVVPTPAAAMDWVAPRPAWSVLGSRRGAPLTSLDAALARFSVALGRG